MGLNLKLWEWPEIFNETMSRAQISKKEMLKTFNCGVGLVFIIDKSSVEPLKTLVEQAGHQSYDLGEVVSSGEKINFPEGLH